MICLNKEIYMKFRPMGDRILIKPIIEEAKFGNVVLANDKYYVHKGDVVAVAKGKKNEEGIYQPIDIEIGSEIIYPRNSGLEIYLDDIKHVVLDVDAVVAVSIRP